MWREILRIINEATVDGLVQGNYDTNIDKTFLEKLAHSNEVFSAFKVHNMGVDMAKKMRTDEGKLKPFSEWKKDIKSIASHYCGAWLQTEYNTATLRAKFAAEWKQYEADADIMPNLRWMPTTSANPEEEHKGYWMNRLTLPVGDKFWDKHHPGDHWNCKCSLEQTDEPANPDVLSHIPDVKAQKGLAANPGKTGEMFDRNHPYYEKKCSSCWVNKNKSFKDAITPSGNCNKCPLMNSCTEKARMEHDKLLAERCAEYQKYKTDKNYDPESVKYDPKTGGLKAIHKGHNVHKNDENILIDGMTGDQLEKECQDEIYRMGHKAILRNEQILQPNGNIASCLDLELDDRIMDIVSVTEYNGKYGSKFTKKDGQIKRAREQSGDISDSVCIYFHDPSMFHEDVFVHDMDWYKKYKEGHTQRIHHVHVVIRGGYDIIKYDI